MPTQYIVYPSSSGGGATTVTADQGDPNTLANAWPVKVTDGTDLALVSAAGELNVIVTSALPAGNNNIGDVDIASSVLPTGAATSANQTTEIGLLTSIDGNIIIADTDNVTVVSTVLPTGAATSANQTTEIGLLTSIDGNIVIADTDNVTVVSSVLPTGAATEATLSSLNGKVVAVDTGAVVVASSALPTGAATAANQATEITALNALNARTSGSLVPLEFDEIDLTYVTVGNGIGQIETAEYKLATVLVRTLTMTYNGDDKLASVVAS